MLVIAYIAMSLYHWDVSWFLMMESFDPQSRVVGFILSLTFIFADFVIYNLLDGFYINKDKK
jgi:hypothetical protein